MRFSMTHIYYKKSPVETFDEASAPDWLTGRNAIAGSTMDNSWFWRRHILSLAIGESVKTEFREITRIA